MPPRRQLGLLWGAVAVALVALSPLASHLAGLLPPCPLKSFTGVPCPGCGTTRAALALGRLDVGAAFAVSPLAAAAWGLLVGGGLAAGALALAAAGWGWAQSAPDAVPFVIQLVSLSLATGGALAALVLGHWYLVTPRVSERPLLLQTRLLSGVIALQVALFLTWALFGGGPGQTPFESLTGGAALLGWLRLVVTLLFPLALAVMAWATARTRSMESATGLLYIGIAAILAGTIGAGALYVSAGLLV